MKGIIIYKGKYGATQQYADWAGAAMRLPVMASHECRKQDIADCDFLVLGTSVYIGVLVLREWIKENLDVLMGKRIFMFVVSGTSLDDKVKLESYIQNSIPERLRQHCEIYFLPGKLNYKKLSWSDKLLLRIGAMLAGKGDQRKAMLSGYDSVKKENLMQMMNDIAAFSKSNSLNAVI
ncbi:MAG: flavodoxin domain-containing protein [Bacteroidota bacterium]